MSNFCAFFPGKYQLGEIKGYQVTVELNDGSRSCIQILPKPEQEPAEAYRLRIKDPSFVSIYYGNYTFYFGRTQVQALVECPESSTTSSAVLADEESASRSHLFTAIDSLCVDESLKSEQVEVGIKKASDVDTSKPIYSK